MPLSPPIGQQRLIKQRLKSQFYNCHHSDNPPKARLFTDWDVFEKSMPVIEVDGSKILKLCECPFWAKDEDMAEMVEVLEGSEDFIPRYFVRYVSGPRRIGKTSSIAAAFCESAEVRNIHKGLGPFAYYLYLSFSSKNSIKFVAKGKATRSSETQRNQGAAFCLELVKRLLNAELGEDAIELDVDDNPNRLQYLAEDLAGLLEEQIPDGNRILVHVDDCAKMSESVYFRQGFLKALQEVRRVTVVVTDIEPIAGFSSVQHARCVRCPVPMPLVDVKQAIRALPQLEFPKTALVRESHTRSYQALLLRLGMTLPNYLGSIHAKTVRGSNFLSRFEMAVEGASSDPLLHERSTTDALERCLRLARFKCTESSVDKKSAVDLLRGIDDEYANQLRERWGDLVANTPNSFSAMLEKLLCMGQVDNGRTKEHSVFEAGRDRFRSLLDSDGAGTLATTPLKAAYAWTISCLSAANYFLKLDTDYLEIECQALKAGRLFKGDTVSSRIVVPQADETVYYADDEGGILSHPLADLFFRTKDDELVLIEITDKGAASVVDDKVAKHTEWVTTISKTKVPTNIKCLSYIIAPNDMRENSYQNNVRVLRGSYARRYLGGLRQCYRHLVIDV